MSIEAAFLQDGDCIDYTPASAVVTGEVLALADGRTAVATAPIAANVKGAVRVKGIFNVTSASSTTFSIGDYAWWDSSASVAITAPGEAADLYLGVVTKAKVDGDTVVQVDLNATPIKGTGVVMSRVVEVDCQADAQAAAQNIIPAAWNQTGLLFLAAYGIVTEAFAGGDEDQGIITIEDSDGTDLSTLTATDGSGDSLGDVIVGTNDLFSATTNDAAKSVAAGKGVQALVSQETSGASAAGKAKVYVLFLPTVA